jgi:hypothetical protein
MCAMPFFCWFNKKDKENVVRLRGRKFDSRQLVEDGLGLGHQNLSPLVNFKQSPPGYHHQELNNQEQHQRYLSQSQFYPNEMNDYNFQQRNAIDAAAGKYNPEQSTFASSTGTMAVVHPENISRKCYSTAQNDSRKKMSKRLSMSTTVPSYIADENMRGHSIDKRDAHNYSDTPKTARPLYANRHLSQSHVDFYNHVQYGQQNLQPLSENSPENSSTTGAHYSQPRKPTSVVELPSAPIQPQFYSSNAQFQKFNNEHPPTPTGFDNFQPLKSSTPKFNGSEYVTPQQFYATTTTFGTEPQRKSTFIFENNTFNPDEPHTRRQSTSAEIFTDQTSQTEENNTLHSPMSNSGHSSSAATTTTTDTIMPTFFSNGPSNKVAVAPQPQKRSNRNSSTAKEEIPRFRTQVSHSPYQINSASSNGVTASRSGHRLNRLSSEVFIDGPPPTTPDGHTDVRVSLLEDKIRNIESELSGRNTSSSSRQNMIFAAPSEAQRTMMNEIIDKDILIGQLKSRLQGLAAQLERQQMEYDEERRLTQKEIKDTRNQYSAVKKKLQQINEQLDACDTKKDEEIGKLMKELTTVKEQIRLRDLEIIALKQRLAASSDSELIKLREEVRAKEHANSELQDELFSKNAKIKQLEKMLESLHGCDSPYLNSSKSCNKPEFKLPQRHCGVETLTEIDTEEDDEAFRRDLTTPTPTSKSTFSLSSMTSQGDEKPITSLPSSFNSLIRTHYRKTQICHELAKSISEANARILEGKRTEAGRLLGFITDTEGDDSEAINSETTLTNSKMTINVAERFLRKECDMLNHLEKYLNEVRINHIEACQKGPKIFAKNPDCRVQ